LDVPYLANKHHPEAYGPVACLADVLSAPSVSARPFDPRQWHALETVKGTSFAIGDIEVTPYQIGTEEIDWWFLREMAIRPLRHGRPGSVPLGIRFLRHHLFGRCFAFHFQFQSPNTTMLFLGNLTDDVAELREHDHVDVLVIPYCPANGHWLQDTQFLVQRFAPKVTLVHHFDNFAHPYTLSNYMNLSDYQQALRRTCPDARFFFSKFATKVELSQIVAANG
jgi:hypothetical protein